MLLDRIKVVEYHVIYISTSGNLSKENSPCLKISRITLSLYYPSFFITLQGYWPRENKIRLR